MQKFQQETPNGHITYHYKSPEIYKSNEISSISHNEKPKKFGTSQNSDVFTFTTNCFPRSLKSFDKASIPFGVFIKPFFSENNGEPIPTIPETKILLRCAECRTFANPFFHFVDKGDFYVCNICGHKGQTPSKYFTEAFNKKTELVHASYDFKVGSDYTKRPNVVPLYFFLVDVSKIAVKAGVIETFSKVVREAIINKSIPAIERSKIGFLAYDSKLYTFSFSKTLKQPKINVSSKDPYGELIVPIPDLAYYNVNIEEFQEEILGLMDSFPSIFAKTEDNGNIFMDAWKTALEIIKPMGGKLIIIQANDEFTDEIDRETSSRSPSSDYFQNFCRELLNKNISTSIFCHSKCFKDIITLGDLVRFSNGDLYYYCEDNESNKTKFFYDLRDFLAKDSAWECVFRVRVSNNWSIANILGNYAVISTDLLYIGNVYDSKTIFYEFQMKNKPDNEAFYIQTCLLFTSSQGERKFRCHNYKVRLGLLDEIYDEINENAISCTIIRNVLMRIYQKKKLDDCKKKIIQLCKQLYKQKLKLKKEKNEDSIAEPFIYFPLNVLAILKHEVLTSSYEPHFTTDKLNAFRINVNSMDVNTTLNYFVPKLYCLNDIQMKNVCIVDEHTGEFIFPINISLSFEMLEKNGIYLMDLGESFILYIRKNAKNEEIKQNIFREKSLQAQNSNELEWTEKMMDLFSQLTKYKNTKYCPAYIVREGDYTFQEKRFLSNLYEDKNFKENEGIFNFSYKEFINFLYE